jgi:large subunit ribosomal protein L25
METVALTAHKREAGTRPRDLRREHKVPGVFYGFGKENLSLVLDYIEFRNAYRDAGQNTIIELDIDGEKMKVLVHDVQYDPVHDTFAHVDFVNVRMDREIQTSVPIKFVGEAPAVKNLGGVLNTTREVVEIKCLPDRLMHEFEVDISGLADFHNAIHVSDLTVPEGVIILDDVELTLVTVNAPAEEEVDEPVVAEGAEGAEVEEGAAEDGEAAEGGDDKSAEGGDDSGDSKEE